MPADETVWQEAAGIIREEQELEDTIIPRYQSGMEIQHWFGFAWNREVPKPLNPANGVQWNLGAGYREVPWAESIDFEHKIDLESKDWWLYQKSDSVEAIWAHGVFEHIRDVPRLLRNCERVLKPGGLLNIVVPHGLSDLQVEDIDHKHAIVEDTWRNIMNNPYYSAGGDEPWRLRIHTQFIMGVVWRNLALFTQFLKE